MKPIRILLIGLLLTSAGCQAYDENSNETSNKETTPIAVVSPSNSPESSPFIDFHIKSVRLGDSEQQVLAKLGQPKKNRIAKVDNCGVTEIKRFEYPGLEVQMDRDLDGKWSVLEMIVSTAGTTIEPDTKLGDDLEEIKSRLGKPNVDQTNSESQTVYFLTRDNDNAQFEFKENKLVKVRLYVNPC